MILMHKDIPVADVTVRNGMIFSVNAIYNKDHYPIGAYTPAKQLQGKFLDNWQKMRCIPSERQNSDRIVQKIGCSLPEAAFKNMAVSLTDCYWFKDHRELTWIDVNYHDNGFANSNIYSEQNPVNFNSPDFTTDGVLKKFWTSIDGVPVLIKSGILGNEAGDKHLLSANEIIASEIAAMMNVSHVNYFPVKLTNGLYTCGSCCFIQNANQEFINALQIKKLGIMNGSPDLLKELEKIGLSKDISDMLVFDSVIGNTDRHEKNFGIIRDAETLEVISAAPLFDSGSSLGWNGDFSADSSFVKPFQKSLRENLRLAVPVECVLPDISDIQKIINRVYSEFGISELHREKVLEMMTKKLEIIKEEIFPEIEESFER